MEEEQSFRDSISTVDNTGKRVWIFPKKPSGKFYNSRKIVSYLLLLLLFSGPFISIGGEPLLQFNILERKFIIFGQVFWPQDIYLFALTMIAMVVFVSLFTVVFGRLFCGWVCPQTIFMEMVFRRIEYWIEGDWKQQQKLKRAPWNRSKIFKKTAKHTVFWLISFLIANTFLAYIIGYQSLWIIVSDNPENHVVGLVSILIFTTIFYLVFTQMREQVCTVVCPYGRLQGVLLDDKSLTVAYDHERGEGRAKFRKNEDRALANKGDCIDCHQCVNVCPTGIDIRNGTQLECVNCTACMDECDFMMEKVGLSKGLIRITSEESIKNKTKFRLTTRVKAYSFLLVLILGLLTTLLVTRSDFEATILRTRGTLYQKTQDGRYSNIYDISVINKTNRDIPVTIELLEGEGEIQIIGDPIVLEKQGTSTSKFMVLIDKDNLESRKTDLLIGIYEGEELIQKRRTTFIGPGL